MKVTCDRATDSLLIVLRDAPIRESDDNSPGVLADFDETGSSIRFEILDASRVVDEPDGVQFATVG